MIWYGIAFVSVVLVAMYALTAAFVNYNLMEYHKYEHKQKCKVLLEKEKRITALKYALRDVQAEITTAEALVQDKDAELNELEAKLKEAEDNTRLADTWAERWRKECEEIKDKTPDWYKAEYLRMIQAAKNDQQMITLLEQSNECLVKDNEKALHDVATLSTKIRELREAYQMFRRMQIAAEPELIFGKPGPFSQISGIEDMKPADEHDSLDSGGDANMPNPASPPDSPREVAAWVECPY